MDDKMDNKIEKIEVLVYYNKKVPVVITPDMGWSWIILISSFLCNVVAVGFVFNSGAIEKHISKDFDASIGYVALVSSILTGCTLIIAPFGSALCNEFGFRYVTITGAIISAIGFTASGFANCVEYLFVSYGILGGIGFGLIFTPSVVIVGYYFDKWRPLAIGIALSGGGFGTFIFAPLLKYLFKLFEWRNTLFFQSGILLTCAFYAATFPTKVCVRHSNTTEDLSENEKFDCKQCLEKFKSVFSSVADKKLFKSPSFILLCCSGFCMYLGYFTPTIYSERRAEEGGMDEANAILIISVIGITNTVSRILCGLITSFKISALLLYNVAVTAAGIAVCISSYSITRTMQYSYAVVFAAGGAFSFVLRPVIIVELLGLAKLTNAFGYLMFFLGISSFIGSPIAGALYDYTGTFEASFWFAGICLIVAGVLCYPLTCINKWEKKSNKLRKVNET